MEEILKGVLCWSLCMMYELCKSKYCYVVHDMIVSIACTQEP